MGWKSLAPPTLAFKMVENAPMAYTSLHGASFSVLLVPNSMQSELSETYSLLCL